MLAVDLVRRGAARHATRTAERCVDRSMTFGEVNASSNRIAHVLTGVGGGGRPDVTWVESVTAFVTLRPGQSVQQDQLQDVVRARLAGYKVPKAVHVVDAIPISPVGKVLRRALRDPLGEGRR